MKWLTAAWLTALAACTTTNKDDLNVLPRNPPDGWAQLRIVDAAPNLEPFDVYFSDLDEAILGDVSYGLAEGFIEVATQDYTVQLRAAGEAVDYPEFYSQDVNLPNMERHTIVLAGTSSDGSALQLIDVIDDLARVDPGTLQVVNAGSSAASFDFGSDGVVELPDVEPLATARAATPDLTATTVTISGTTYVMPARPTIGDVLLVTTDTLVMLVTYSFTVQDLQAQ